MEQSADYMARALALARRALGSVSPNPAVGAVLVKDGHVVGEGFTQLPGEAHAEVVALRQAGSAAQSATLYVTLEPCAYHGRTPPCADAVVGAGVAEVRIGTLDPNPKTDARGVAVLEAAGIRVTVGEREEESREVVEAFAKHVVTGLPFVTAKFAASLDGKLATPTGSPRWISGEASRRIAHRLRAESDAVMVGIGTALADDPRLTARDVDEPPARQPLRVVVDSSGRLAAKAAMLREPGDTLVAAAKLTASQRRTLEQAGAEVLEVPDAQGRPKGRVNLGELLRKLGSRGVTSVLAEGGGTLLGTLFDARLVDKVVAFVTPVIIGGEGVPSPAGGGGAEHVAEALRLRRVRYEQVGEDMMAVGYVDRI